MNRIPSNLLRLAPRALTPASSPLPLLSTPYSSLHTNPSNCNLQNWVEKLPPTRLSSLSNGMIVATQPSFGQTATVGVYIKAGSVYENEQNNGVAHFLEHMFFKGTERRTRAQIEEEVENIGASLNAYTAREQIAYIGHSTSESYPQVVDILSDILLHSKLSTSAVEGERSVILAEMKDVNSRSDELLFDLLHESAFPSCPLGYTILGPEKNIKSISQQQLRDYITTHYTADRMFLVGAGQIDHQKLHDLAEEKFGALPARSTTPLVPYDADCFTGSVVEIEDDSMNVAHLILAHEGLPADHGDQTALDLLTGMIGNWDKRYGVGKTTSPLCEEVAHQQLAHSITPFNTTYKNSSLYGIYAIARPECLRALCTEIYKYFHYVAESVTEEEVESMKERAKNQRVMQPDNTTTICEEIGRQFLVFGRRVSVAEALLRIDAVTVHDIRRVAKNLLTNQYPAVATMGPLKDMPKYDELLEMGKGNFTEKKSMWGF